MFKTKNLLYALLLFSLLFVAGCAQTPLDTSESMSDMNAALTEANTQSDAQSEKTAANSRVITDALGRSVEIPGHLERIVCGGVGALRYTTYLGAQDLVVGVSDAEIKEESSINRLYNYVNFDYFSKLPVIGSDMELNPEEIIKVDPQLIVLSKLSGDKADQLQEKTAIPVVVVPGSDSALDQACYDTLELMGEVYGMQQEARDLIAYLQGIELDLQNRVASIPDEQKPSVYVGGVSYKGARGFDGTEAHYAPLALINAINLADTTGQNGPFTVDIEQVLAWDPDYLFISLDNLSLIEKDYAEHPEYYQNFKAMQEGKVYSQIPFRYSAVNLDTALANTYYAAKILYPEQFQDIDIEEKTAEIYERLLGSNPYPDQKEQGFEFKQITLGN
ncbi:MAG: iron ABC transporter substrate-binding protein [Coriobacteriia bacterium]|nr:iron ABC transporter substrate-binding protein [Coriobacteriia bacterium]